MFHFTIGFTVCILSGLLCFLLFYKLIEWFDKM
jgi:hypothetical protein